VAREARDLSAQIGDTDGARSAGEIIDAVS
jgi:hypothetical protein